MACKTVLRENGPDIAIELEQRFRGKTGSGVAAEEEAEDAKVHGATLCGRAGLWRMVPRRGFV
jgi:hypothetical protein